MANERLRRRCAVLGIGMIVNQSIAAAQLIHHICQVAPMCTLMVPWTHTSLLPPPNVISIGSPVVAGLAIVTNTQTDRPRYSVVMDMYSCRPMGASVARLIILVSGARSRSWN